MKLPTPTFSERYKAQVEAERQYVSETAQEERSTVIQDATENDGESEARTAIEQAFHVVRSQNRRNPPPSADNGEAA